MKRLVRMVLVGLSILLVWAWKPPALVGGLPPAFGVPAQDSLAARSVADSLFATLGAPIDTFELTPDSTLRLVLQPGAFLRRQRFLGKSCVGGGVADSAIRTLAPSAYLRFGQRRHVRGVEIRLPKDSVSTGGWFWRRSCGQGPNGSFLDRVHLEAMLPSAPPG
jgi:hypothetical protein